MIGRHLRRRHAVVLLGAVALLAAAGAAYASIPDSGGVYTACTQKTTGAVRLIDPEAGSTSPLGRCTASEKQVTWNREGPAGKDGLSPTVTSLAQGDSNCPAGGAAITDTAGSTAYVCSAQTSGTFTSPNGMFSLKVADDGLDIVGPDGAKIDIGTDGGITVRSATEDVRVDGSRTERIGGNDTLLISGNGSERASGTLSVQASGALGLDGAMVGINRSPACKPVARVGDLVDPVSNTIVTGSPTVCID